MEVIYKQNYFDTLSKSLRTAWLRQRYVDVNVKVNGKTYACHKLLLGSFSPFFNNLLVDCDKTVEINDISCGVFEQLLEYMYTGKYDVKENPEEVLKAVMKVQLTGLQEIIEDILRTDLSHVNCIQYFKLARDLGCHGLQKQCWTFILDNFTNVRKGQDFQKLSFDDLVSLINDNDLNTPSEEIVCDAVLGWISSDPGFRPQHLEKLLDYIRFPLMDRSYIQTLSQIPFVMKSKYGEKLVRMYDELLADGDISGIVNPRQFHNRTEEVLCAIGSRSRHPNPETTEMKCYSFNKNLTFTMAKLPNDPGACFAVCSSNNNIYVSGGYMQLTQMLLFTTSTNKWQVCGSLIEGRWGHGMAAVGDNIYILGGNKKQPEPIDTIEMYDTSINKSFRVGSMTIPVSFATLAVVSTHIYIFGGKTVEGEVCYKVQQFDTQTNTCTVIADLPAVTSSTGRCVVIGDTMFVFYGSGEVIRFTKDEAQSVAGRIPKFDHFGVVSYNGLAVIDGRFGNQSSTIVFDPSTGVVSPFSRAIKVNMCNFSCMKVVISKHATKSSN